MATNTQLKNLIRNVWAVGRNYSEHARELGNAAPSPQAEPMIFLKAGSGVVTDRGTFQLPGFSADVHHELEVAFRFGPNGEFDAVTLAIDLTARDLQNKLKSQGHPWTLAKSFRDACLMGPPVTLPQNLEDITFELKINGERRQAGNTRDMIHAPEKLRRYVLERFPVVEGDYLLTGTPAGVGPVRAGDHLEAEIPGVLKASWRAANS